MSPDEVVSLCNLLLLASAAQVRGAAIGQLAGDCSSYIGNLVL